jgi:RNA polymerase sigma-70 factor, ECF subfamily
VTGADTAGERLAADDSALVARLRDGDERAFEGVVRDFYPSMLAVARGYTRTRAVADEVVQEAWVGVLKGLGRFEGRSSLRTWVLQIVANIARTRAVREARSVPFSTFELDAEQHEPAVEPERFRGPDDPYPGHWRSYPTDWRTLPERRLISTETLDLVKRAIEELPENQKIVITLRDVTGCSAAEVCDTLGISPENQRVLLHRARARVRARLERHFDA